MAEEETSSPIKLSFEEACDLISAIKTDGEVHHTLANAMHATKLAIVTGANRGLGLEMCKQLASKGYQVIMAARSEEKGREAQDELRSQGINNVEFMQLDTQHAESM